MPALLSLLVLLFTAAILGVRLLLLNATRGDRAFNVAVAVLIVVAALRDRSIQLSLQVLTDSVITPDLLNQISESAITLSAAAFVMLGLAWLNIPESRARTAAIWLAAIMSVLAVEWVVHYSDPRPAAVHHLHSGWAIVAYSGGLPAAILGIVAHDALSYSFCLLLLTICYQEIRNRPRGLELVACVWVLVLAVGWLVQTRSVSIVTLIAATGRYNAFLGQYAAGEHIGPLFDASGIALLGALPLVRFAVEYMRAEVYSRILNYRLSALWAALTAVCPEIVHSVPELRALSHPRYQLHLRVIEIRDAVMILSRYVTEDMIAFSCRCTDIPARRQAIQLQLASAAKLRGESAASGMLASPVGATAGLIDDAVELLDLVRCWSTAARSCAAENRAEPSWPSVLLAQDSGIYGSPAGAGEPERRALPVQ
jgi:hypothetical protein